MAPNKVLVVGAHAVGKKYLLHRLTKAPSAAHHSSFPVAWTLDTKYYTADMELHVVQSEEYKFNDVDTMKAACGALADAQAVVLVHDVNQESSLEAVKKWAIFAREHEPAVCLLVGNELAAANTGPGCADAAQSWALDNNFEYIEVPCFSSWSDDASNSALAKEAQACHETFGVGRVDEALQCNQWEHWTMKPRPARTGLADHKDQSPATSASTDVVDVGLAVEFEPLKLSSTAQPPELGGAPATPQDASTSASGVSTVAAGDEHKDAVDKADAPKSKAKRKAKKKGKRKRGKGKGKKGNSGPATNGNSSKEPSTVTGASATDPKKATANANPFVLPDDPFGGDDEMEEFAQMLAKVKAVREQSAGLSDKERRDRAADAIMQIMAGCGMDINDF